MKNKNNTTSEPFERSKIARSPNLILEEVCTEQVRHTMRAWLAIHNYAEKEKCMHYFLYILFWEDCSLLTPLNCGQCLQSRMNFTTRRPNSRWTTLGPSKLKAYISLHATLLARTSIFTKSLDCPRPNITETVSRKTVMNSTKAWVGPVKACGIQTFSKIVSP